MKTSLFLVMAWALSGCATVSHSRASDGFFTRLSALCGKAYEGRLVSNDAQDADMAGKRLLMHVRDCSANEIRIPFTVGEDRSRTWVVTRTATGLRLKHDHRHEDGSEDSRSQYGGDSRTPGTESRQEFPADDFSKALFQKEGIAASIDNVWALELQPPRLFAYELRRPNRYFRVEFDLTRTAEQP